MDEAMEVVEMGTTPIEETNAESQTESVEEPATTPQVDEKPTEDVSNDAEQAEPVAPETFTLKYNHEDLTVQKDEAINLAQYGYFVKKVAEDHGVDVREAMADLDYVATLSGKTVGELVNSLMDGIESSYRDDLIDQLGEDNPLVAEMLELRKTKNRKAYEDAKTERANKAKKAAEEADKAISTRLAEQFEAMRETFPEFDTVEKVPETVLKRAMKSGDLEKEMLRYERSERKKVEAAKATQEENKKQNVGSINNDPVEDTFSSAFMRGLRG